MAKLLTCLLCRTITGIDRTPQEEETHTKLGRRVTMAEAWYTLTQKWISLTETPVRDSFTIPTKQMVHVIWVKLIHLKAFPKAMALQVIHMKRLQRLQIIYLRSLYQQNDSPLLLMAASKEIALGVIRIGHIAQSLYPPRHRKIGTVTYLLPLKKHFELTELLPWIIKSHYLSHSSNVHVG